MTADQVEFCFSTMEGIEKHCTVLVQLVPVPSQGHIIQVWPSGQITLTGDVIGSRGGTVRYEATMVFCDPEIKLL